MPIPVCIEHFDLFENFPESSIFYTIMSAEKPNMAMKYSKTFFLKAPIRPLLKWTKARIGLSLLQLK